MFHFRSCGKVFLFCTQMLLLFGLNAAGKFISESINIPLPGSMVGMMILFVLLLLGVVQVENVMLASDWLLKHMSFFLIPAGIYALRNIYEIKNEVMQIIIICFISTAVVIAATGITVQSIRRRTNVK